MGRESLGLGGRVSEDKVITYIIMIGVGVVLALLVSLGFWMLLDAILVKLTAISNTLRDIRDSLNLILSHVRNARL
jgi:hypothetical protein